MDEDKLPRAPASTTSLDPSLQKNENEDGDDVKRPDLPEEAADEKPATAPKDIEKVYVTGIPLALVISAVTMVVFLVLLDMSIIATVRNSLPARSCTLRNRRDLLTDPPGDSPHHH
jgi:hypothetical protein